jgi:hypothetical protein
LVFVFFLIALAYYTYKEFKKRAAAHAAGHAVPISSRDIMIKIAALHMIVSELQNIFVYCGRLLVLWREANDYTAVRNSGTGNLVYAHLDNLDFNEPSDSILRRWRCDDLILEPGASLIPAGSFKFLLFRLSPNTHVRFYFRFSL